MRCARFLSALAALVFSSPALANPLDAYGFGARAIALGGATTCTSHGFAATYYNPASLAERGQPLALEVGYTFSEPVLRLDGRDLDVDPSHGFQGGITIPGEIFEHHIGVALGLHLPDGLISRVRTLPQARPRFVLYDNRPQRLVVSTSAAVEILDGLYFGAGLTYIAGTKGVLDVVGTVSASDAERTRLFSSVDVRFSSVRYPTVSVLYVPADDWRFGVTYRHEFVLTLDLDVRVRGDITIGDSELVAVENGSFLLDSFNTDLFSPRQLVLGAAHTVGELTFSFDLAWLDWSRFPPPVSAIDLVVDLGELDVEVPVPDKPQPAEFRDIFVPRFGVEWLLSEVVELRGGYTFEPSPAPAQPGVTNYVDSAKHIVSVGMGLNLPIWPEIFPAPLVFDVAVSGIFLAGRDYVKDDPADSVGDYRAGGQVYSAAATLGVEFP